VKLATVNRWHRRGFARFWAWKSRLLGRPPLAPEFVSLIKRMARENPLWPRRRIASDLAKLGYRVSKDTAKGAPPPPSQAWKTFVGNHLGGTIAIDFLTLPTVTSAFYVFLVLSRKPRRLLHINVTAHPRATWTAPQIVEALGVDARVARLIRDRDAIYGAQFDARVDRLGMKQIRIAPCVASW
jgi:putative transposase